MTKNKVLHLPTDSKIRIKLHIYTCVWSSLTSWPPQEQEEGRAHVPAAGGGSETEAGGVESSVQALLCPESSPAAAEPLALQPLPPHVSLAVFTTALLHGEEEEDADISSPRRVSADAEGGVESRVQEVLRPENCPSPDGPHAVRTPAPEHGAWRRDTGAWRSRVPRQQRRNHVQLTQRWCLKRFGRFKTLPRVQNWTVWMVAFCWSCWFVSGVMIRSVLTLISKLFACVCNFSLLNYATNIPEDTVYISLI